MLEIIGIILLVILIILPHLLIKNEGFENYGSAFFQANGAADKFFENSGKDLEYDDNPSGKLSAINNNNNIGLDSGDLGQIDPNNVLIDELQELVSKGTDFQVIYSGGDIVLDSSFVANSLGRMINDFNKEKKTEYSILNVINNRLTPNYYYFNAFISESKINSNMKATIAMSRDGSKILALSSDFSSRSNESTQFKPVKDPKNPIIDSSGFFELKNELGLFYPYSTTREELVISQSTVQAYKDKIAEIKDKKGSCFNTINAVNYSTSNDCIAAGGTWKSTS
jgi:hypothetical protein